MCSGLCCRVFVGVVVWCLCLFLFCLFCVGLLFMFLGFILIVLCCSVVCCICGCCCSIWVSLWVSSEWLVVLFGVYWFWLKIICLFVV